MKRITFLLTLLLTTAVQTFANSKTDYYFKTKVEASGSGKVYASTSATDTPNYKESITVDPGVESASSAPTKTIYLWVQPEDGMSYEWVTDLTIIPLYDEGHATAMVDIVGSEDQNKVNLITVRFYNPQKQEGSLTLQQTSLSLTVGDTGIIGVENKSHDAAIVWTSSNEHVVSIAEDGSYTALEGGVAVITAELQETDEFSSAKATCTIEVSKPATPYQVQNSDFELWDDAGTAMQEPAHWNSFQHATGSLSGTVAAQQVSQSEDVRPGSTGTSSAYIYSRNVMMGIAAQGNLTTGCINGGSMQASDGTGNYNYTNVDDPDFHQRLTGLPDSMRVWVKYQPSSANTKAKVSARLHTEGYFQDPYANEDKIGDTKSVAHVDATVDATGDEWKEVVVPFTYDLTDGTRPAFALISFATCNVPGGGSTSDKMYIDDLSLVYNSELTAVVIGDETIPVNGNDAAIPSAYDPESVRFLTNAQSASIETEYDEETFVLTVIVKGDDISENPSNQHTYTIRFQTTEKVYSDKLMVTINGVHNVPQDASIIRNGADGEPLTFQLKNFMLGEGESMMAIGNITLTDVEVAEDGTFSTRQNVTIEPGDAEGVTMWFGDIIGTIPVQMDGKIEGDAMEAIIQIDLKSALQQVVEVRFGSGIIYITDLENVYCGTEEVTFEDKKATIEGCYTDNPVVVTTVGWAEVEQRYDGDTNVLTLNVSTTNPATEQTLTDTYTIQFTIPVGVRTLSADTDSAIYDLNGRKVLRTQKSRISIVNGQKVLVK